MASFGCVQISEEKELDVLFVSDGAILEPSGNYKLLIPSKLGYGREPTGCFLGEAPKLLDLCRANHKDNA